MVKKKTRSHRQKLGTKYMINKKAQAHKKKLGKASKKNGGNRKPLKKALDIPNLWPYKEQLLNRILKDKDQAKEAANAQPTLEYLDADHDMEHVDDSVDELGTSYNRNRHQTGNYFKELRKVVEECDVILEVLDARDPLGCRSPQLEERILSHHKNKRLVLVLNKIDLVPREVATQWLDYLRKEFPTVAFKASTQTQRSNLASNAGNVTLENMSDDLKHSKNCVGSGTLMKLLKNYCRNGDMKTSITVGVIGMPNVGKSSLINSMKRSRVAGVGSTPGFTKSVQEIQIDSKIKILDSPGVVIPDMDDNAESSLALRNSLRVETLSDPIGTVHTLVAKCNPADLRRIYDIAAFQNADEFIMLTAFKKGKLKRGGVADLEASAVSILRDWNDGKIPFYTLPPEVPASTQTNSSAAIVDSIGPELDLDAMFASTEAMEGVVAEQPPVAHVCIGQSTLSTYKLDLDDEEMDEGDVPSATMHENEVEDDDLNPKRNGNLKKQMKNNRKAKRKQLNKAMKETEGQMDEDSYDFDEHFQ